MGYVFLAGAIASEVAATMSLRASEGFSKLGFTALVAVGYITAFALLSAALERGLPLGIAYGIWAAVGVAAVAILSVPIFGESLTAMQIGGLALVISGVIALEIGGAH
ncbi:MAG: multidrug efflux SMR transporter [Solirubrobacterales bacterium]